MKAKRSSRNLNFLRAHRKRSALSQDEIAFLLGAQNGSKVCRYEQMLREPKLKTALAYEAIFNCAVTELFPELYAKVKAAVQERAKTLAKRALQGNSKALRAQKRKPVSAIISQQKNKREKK
jgi:transcriptional regulator with XRE-family HTH domain